MQTPACDVIHATEVFQRHGGIFFDAIRTWYESDAPKMTSTGNVVFLLYTGNAESRDIVGYSRTNKTYENGIPHGRYGNVRVFLRPFMDLLL